MAAEQPTSMVAAGGRFAAACGLLRQYMMMEHGRRGRGAVTMGLVPAAQAVAAGAAPEERIDNKTMELFPQQPGALKLNKSSSHQRSRILEPGRAQLTIFYGGCTIVLDDFPADKADELMLLASSFVAPDDAPAPAAAEPVCPDVLAQLQPFLAGRPRSGGSSARGRAGSPPQIRTRCRRLGRGRTSRASRLLKRRGSPLTPPPSSTSTDEEFD